MVALALGDVISSHRKLENLLFTTWISLFHSSLEKQSAHYVILSNFRTELLNNEPLYYRSGQVRYGGIRRSSASPCPPYDGTPSASVWVSPRQTPGPSCPLLYYRLNPNPSLKAVSILVVILFAVTDFFHNALQVPLKCVMEV